MNALLAISLLVCLTGATAFQEVSSAEYIALTAAEKSEIIWSNVMEDLTPADWFSLLEMPGIFTESMCPTLRAPGKRGSVAARTELRCVEVMNCPGRRELYLTGRGTNISTPWGPSARSSGSTVGDTPTLDYSPEPPRAW